ncbi:MAG: four helix bundle protein [Candidatus Shapirobacteria bacterium]|nr:four helix bundle protein [Candidatus Shapirobacteria bacterium]MDD4410505.1 four helix bundle protein [Candidatus Shapirobacteria bacterium]
MKIEKFEDLVCWKKSQSFIIEIYKVFSSCKDYSFKDQIVRAAVSISNNIAEGFERLSNKDFRKFLYISKGSCGEVRSMLYLSKELKYVTEEEFNFLYNQSIEISKILSGLIKSL